MQSTSPARVSGMGARQPFIGSHRDPFSPILKQRQLSFPVNLILETVHR